LGEIYPRPEPTARPSPKRAFRAQPLDRLARQTKPVRQQLLALSEIGGKAAQNACL
jgi:hypothetical protein